MPLCDYETTAAENCADLRSCNYTELYQSCRDIGVNPHPTMSKNELVGLIEGTLTPGTYTNPVDEWRDGIMAFLLNYWRKVSGQLMCPAKSGDPKACYQCLDAQVFHCMSANKEAEQGVLQLIKKFSTEKISMPPTAPTVTPASTALKPENAPRALEELCLLERKKLVQLVFGLDLSKDMARRSAVMQLSTDKLAREVHESLKRWDAANGVVSSAPAPAQVPAVMAPTATAQEPAAAMPKRQRRTAAEIAAANNAATAAPSPLAPEAGSILAEVQAALGEVTGQLNAQASDFVGKLEAQQQVLQSMETKLTAIEAALHATLSVLLGMSEMHFGITKPDTLEMALVDVNDVGTMLGKAS